MNKQRDFFELQDSTFDLTQKVLRLAGEQAYLSIPTMSIADDEESLLEIERYAKNVLRLRRNKMARARRLVKKPTGRGRWTHKHVFTEFLRYYGRSAKNDSAWSHYLTDNEILKCEQCGMYADKQLDAIFQIGCKNSDILDFCCDECAADFLHDLEPIELEELDNQTVRSLLEETHENSNHT